MKITKPHHDSKPQLEIIHKFIFYDHPITAFFANHHNTQFTKIF
ncbi:hypothetical protein OH687_16225 [Burkholderia anthina]|nr:hypothetical protein OH687_16225 [Burkholderia anthina]